MTEEKIQHILEMKQVARKKATQFSDSLSLFISATILSHWFAISALLASKRVG